MQRCFQLGGGGGLDDFHFRYLELADAFLKLLEKAGIADAGEPFGRVRRDEGAFALHLHQQVLAHQFPQRFTQGHPADRQLARQLMLRWDLRTGRIHAAVNSMP
jgi:hypothetical protein